MGPLRRHARGHGARSSDREHLHRLRMAAGHRPGGGPRGPRGGGRSGARAPSVGPRPRWLAAAVGDATARSGCPSPPWLTLVVALVLELGSLVPDDFPPVAYVWGLRLRCCRCGCSPPVGRTSAPGAPRGRDPGRGRSLAVATLGTVNARAGLVPDPRPAVRRRPRARRWTLPQLQQMRSAVGQTRPPAVAGRGHHRAPSRPPSRTSTPGRPTSTCHRPGSPRRRPPADARPPPRRAGQRRRTGRVTGTPTAPPTPSPVPTTAWRPSS